MAAFGSFAGLATAGIGALCSHEVNALHMFDLGRTAVSSSSSSNMNVAIVDVFCHGVDPCQVC